MKRQSYLCQLMQQLLGGPGGRDPSIQILPTLCPKVCKYYLHWAIWIPRVTVLSLYGLGFRDELQGSIEGSWISVALFGNHRKMQAKDG